MRRPRVPTPDEEALKQWGRVVFLRDERRCQYCKVVLKKEKVGSHPHHIFSRVKRSTRYDTRNGVCLCAYHHRFYAHGQFQEEFRDFIKKWMGETLFYTIKQLSQVVVKHLDLKLVIWGLTYEQATILGNRHVDAGGVACPQEQGRKEDARSSSKSKKKEDT